MEGKESAKGDSFYEDAAQRIFEHVGYKNSFEKQDAVWENEKTKARVYVGGESAASNLELLQSTNVKRIVNCRGNVENTLENEKSLKFFKMPITSWASSNLDTSEKVWDFLKDLFAFVDEGLENGESVLIHCLAGAHRAPTTAAAYLLYKTHKDITDVAIHLKACRPIVDLRSFGGSSEFLFKVQHALQELKYPNALESK